MSWLVDNATTWFLLLGIAFLGFAAAWWSNRRRNLLIGAGVALGLLALLWILTQLVVTDRRKIEIAIRAMAEAVVNGRADILDKHLASDFIYHGSRRQDAIDGILRAAKVYQVREVRIFNFEVLDQQERTIRVFFRAAAHGPRDDRSFPPVACRALFVKDGEHWRMKEARFYNPLVNQDQEMVIPLR